MHFALPIIFLLQLLTCFFPIVQPLCLSHDRLALLQLKNSFTIDKDASEEASAYSKVASWASEGTNHDECCSWDGVKCDQDTGHVIGLDLTSSWLYGSIDSNSTLFKLSQLQNLSLADNDFNDSPIPFSIGSLYSLKVLDLSGCQFSGLLPRSLGGLRGLSFCYLAYNNLTGPIPSSLQNLTHITELSFAYNQLHGQLPAWLGNLTQLTWLNLRNNMLHGVVPHSFSGLRALEALLLSHNELKATLEIDMFLDMKYLRRLQLSGNKLWLRTETNNSNATVSKFEVLHLGSCNLSNFPSFLRYQQKLKIIDLWENQISGKIPKWLWNTSRESLGKADFSRNSLTGFDQTPPVVLPWVRLVSLDLSQNALKGSLPIPPASIIQYDLSDNELSGEISQSLGNKSSLQLVDLSNNNLSGVLPRCLEEELTDSLSILNLASNNFHGTIPQIGAHGSKLQAIDLGHNQLEGPLPSSLANCTMLEFLNLGNNKLDDGFPSWLGALPNLRLLLLRKNKLRGVINEPVSDSGFPKLRVIDLSHNRFTGLLPPHYLTQWSAMKRVNITQSSYLSGDFVFFYYDNTTYWGSYTYSMNIANKGTDIAYSNIQAIDLKERFLEALGVCKGFRCSTFRITC
ncbi:receptor-like protein 7 [Humulus lupulus]|uniref:receptor-like protein 7 n=1 Tax=Humulus lupulus TaxID=3486 RepID=UPI002B415858|nr:receptor-like protein 7 [Humulus lupulus]